MKTATLRRGPAASAAGAEAGEVEVTVVMPCLNEARTVGRCVEKALRSLRELGVRGEVVVADNGSTDGSQVLAREHGARVVHAERKGYGSALQAGIAAARGAYVIMGDADDSYDFTRLGAFVERLRAGDELVMGNRFKGGILPGAMPRLHRYVGNPVLTGILNLFFRSPIGDAHCGLRAFRKDSCLRLGLSCPGMEFASEMVVKAVLAGQRISEVPTTLAPDGRDRPPHLRSFRDGWRHLRFLLLFCPLWLYLIPAAALLAGGLALLTGAVPGPLGLFGGALGAVLGCQLLWLWAHARAYGAASGLLPGGGLASRVRLEHALVAGGGLAAAGLAAAGLALAAAPAAPDAGAVRYAVWGLTVMAIGLQTAFGGFLLGMIRLPHQALGGAGPLAASRAL